MHRLVFRSRPLAATSNRAATIFSEQHWLLPAAALGNPWFASTGETVKKNRRTYKITGPHEKKRE